MVENTEPVDPSEAKYIQIEGNGQNIPNELADKRLALYKKQCDIGISNVKKIAAAIGSGVCALLLASNIYTAYKYTVRGKEREALRLLFLDKQDELEKERRKHALRTEQLRGELKQCKREDDKKLTVIANYQPFLSDLLKCNHNRKSVYLRGRCFDKAVSAHIKRQKQHSQHKP